MISQGLSPAQFTRPRRVMGRAWRGGTIEMEAGQPQATPVRPAARIAGVVAAVTIRVTTVIVWSGFSSPVLYILIT